VLVGIVSRNDVLRCLVLEDSRHPTGAWGARFTFRSSCWPVSCPLTRPRLQAGTAACGDGRADAPRGPPCRGFGYAGPEGGDGWRDARLRAARAL